MARASSTSMDTRAAWAMAASHVGDEGGVGQVEVVDVGAAGGEQRRVLPTQHAVTEDAHGA